MMLIVDAMVQTKLGTSRGFYGGFVAKLSC